MAISFVSREEERTLLEIEALIGQKIRRIMVPGYEVSSRDDLIKQLQERRRFGKRPQREDNAPPRPWPRRNCKVSASSAWRRPRSPVSRNKATSHPPGRGGAFIARRHWRLCAIDDAALAAPFQRIEMTFLLTIRPCSRWPARAWRSWSAPPRNGKRTPAQESHFLCTWMADFLKEKRFSRLVMEDLKTLGATGADAGGRGRSQGAA
jgi:hypothetical protein